MKKIILVDFAGTLVKANIIEQANILRAQVLQKSMPEKQLHADPEAMYKVNREFVEQLTGLPSDATIKYRKNDLGFVELTGTDVQNQIATTLFQIGMYMVAKEKGRGIFVDGMIEELQRIQKAGYALAIVSGVRTDIITGMFSIVKCPLTFDYVYGQPPKLGAKNQQADVEHLQSIGTITHVIGDKKDDLERGNIQGCKKIFVTWGHPSGGEEKIAHYAITSAHELKKIF